jgi:hypothetical protein
MTDLVEYNGVHADHSPTPVLTPKARTKAVRARVEELMEELTERHDGNPDLTYLAVRQVTPR